jgi:hypothetical protein
MTNKKDELELGDEISLELGDDTPEVSNSNSNSDDSSALSLDEGGEGIDLSLEDSNGSEVATSDSDIGGLDLSDTDDAGLDFNIEDSGGADSLDLTDAEAVTDDASLDLADETLADDSLELGDNSSPDENLDLAGDENLLEENSDLDLASSEQELNSTNNEQKALSDELSDDALKKLQEIDAMLMGDSDSEVPASKPAPKNKKQELKQEAITADSLDFTAQKEERTQVIKSHTSPAAANVKLATKSDLDDIKNFHTDEMERLIVTIKALREDRENLLQKVHQLEDGINQDKSEVMALRAEIDERKIELSISRKRYEKQIEELKFQNEVIQEKKELVEVKYKDLEKELQKANQKVKMDINRVKSREQELENQLELLRADSQMQIRNRDQKILELKRRIDIIEFDMENVLEKEKSNKNIQVNLEDKLEKVIGTLRTAIEALEDESSAKKKIKKDLEA